MSGRVGTVGSTKIRLARGVEKQDAYQRRYIPVDPQGFVTDDPARAAVAADDQTRVWAIRSWRDGEGENVWRKDRSAFRQSSDVRPVSVGDGLELGAKQEITQDSSGSSDFDDGEVFGRGLRTLWVGVDSNVYQWDTANERWGSAISTGQGFDLTSIVEGGDEWMYGATVAETLWRFKSGSSENVVTQASGVFTTDPVAVHWDGLLFVVNNADLEEVDRSTTNTVTTRVDHAPAPTRTFRTITPWSWNRAASGDAGPVWLEPLDSGVTHIWTYAADEDVERRLGQVPVDMGFPYSVVVHQGFVFVGFRWASEHGSEGDAHIYFQRGAQRGVTDPIRAPSGVTASKPVLLAGMIGDDLIFYYDGAVWAYNLTEGGVFMVAESSADSTAGVWSARTFGKDVFIAPVTEGAADQAVERFITTEYTSSGTIDSGRFDFDYPGLDKLLLDVTVITDPLPSGTSVTCSVSVDGGSFTALSGTHDTDDATEFTWNASTSSASFRGKLFEIRLTLATTDSDETPTVRELTSRATGAAHRIEWVLQVDADDTTGQNSKGLLDNLNSLATSSTVVSFTDVWQNPASDSGDTFDVTVEEVLTPKLRESDSDAAPVATVRLRTRSLV